MWSAWEHLHPHWITVSCHGVQGPMITGYYCAIFPFCGRGKKKMTKNQKGILWLGYHRYPSKNDEYDNKIIKTSLRTDIWSNNPLILITDSTVQCTLICPRPYKLFIIKEKVEAKRTVTMGNRSSDSPTAKGQTLKVSYFRLIKGVG